MENLEKLCLGCMQDIGSADQCLACGFSKQTIQQAPFLPIGTTIDGRYYIGKVLESNGDGATYLAWHIDRNVPVTIREFLPDSISSRSTGETFLNILSGCELVFSDCMQSFLDLWRNLARRRGLSALVPVIDIIEANNTVYVVSENIEGLKLSEYLAQSHLGHISWEQARLLFMPVLSTLGALHNAGIIHRGISPDTLIVCYDGRIRITGFSIWQVRTATSDLHTELFEGYSAIEQYGKDLPQGSWTDVYSLAAVLYRSLIGKTPLDAPKRSISDTLMIPARFAERLPNFVIDTLIDGLQVMPEDRMKTIEQMRNSLSGKRVQEPVPPPPPPPKTKQTIEDEKKSKPTDKEKKDKEKTGSQKSLKVAVSLLIVLLVASIGLFAFYYFDNTGFLNNILPWKIEGPLSNFNEKHKEMRTVPNFVGKTLSSIENTPANFEGFELEFVDENSLDFEVGTVIRQDIETNAQVVKGTKITLYVSIGPRQIVIPDVRGLSFEDAEAQLKANGLVCERSLKANDGSQEAGTVADTMPSIGSSVNEGSVVFINIWKEPETQAETTTRLPSIWDILG